jgi:RimJ/RimL family protein N-acetyltransferase
MSEMQISKPVRLYDTALNRNHILMHLLALELPDRYLRFCSALSNEAIKRYVDQLELNRKDIVFAVFNSDYRMVGMLHVAPISNADSAEFALSVDVEVRKRGIGDALFERGLLHCESMGIKNIYMNCLSSNQAIKKMARKRNMTITNDYGDTVATLDIKDTAQVAAWLETIRTDTVALYDLRCLPMRQAWEDYVQEVTKIAERKV